VLVPSQAARRALGAAGYAADRLHVWRFGVDAYRFAPSRASARLRAAWHVDARRPAILLASPPATREELDLFIAIRALLHRHALAHEFVCVSDSAAQSGLLAACPELVLAQPRNDEETASVLASADVCLVIGQADALAPRVLEAQACGVPVVVSDAGAPREYMAPEATGAVCDGGSPESFVRALSVLLRNPARRAAMGRAARELARDQGWTRTLEPLWTAWRSALRSAARASEPATHLADVGTRAVLEGAATEFGRSPVD
jgi:phosphatidylinositol alpha 1,6-mannosyltransferase